MVHRLLSLTILALFLGFPLYGQLQPKTIFTGGNAALVSDVEDYLNTSLSTQAGIMLNEQFAIGGGARQSGLYYFGDFDYSRTRTDFLLFGRYYFPNTGKKALFLTIQGSVGSDNYNQEGDEFDFSYGRFSLYGGLGHNWFLAPTAGIEAGLGVQYLKVEDQGDQTTLLGQIGLQLFLPPKSEAPGKAKPGLAKGMMMIGGSGNLIMDLAELDRVFSGNAGIFSIQPVFGFQLNPNWMVGSELYFFSDFDNSWSGRVSPFARLYVTPDKKLKVFAEGMAGIRFGTSDTILDLQGSAGITHFLTTNMAIEGFLGYNISNDIKAADDWAGTLVGGIGLRAFVGR